MEKFKIAVVISILVVVLIAYLDIGGVILLGEEYTQGNFPADFWNHFRNSALLIMLIVPLVYFFYRKDKSETLAIFLTSFTLWTFGLADVLFFWLQGKAVPKALPWLNAHPIIGRISQLSGWETVSGDSLVISVLLGIVVVYILVKLLKNKL